MPAAYGETAGKVVAKIVRPFMTDPVKHGCRSGLFAATSPEMVEGEGVHGQYVMPDKKISEVSKQGAGRFNGDEAVESQYWTAEREAGQIRIRVCDMTMLRETARATHHVR
jgi:hypothetical protein